MRNIAALSQFLRNQLSLLFVECSAEERVSLEWLSVQLYGHLYYNSSLVSFPKSLRKYKKQLSRRRSSLASMVSTTSKSSMPDMDVVDLNHERLKLSRTASNGRMASYIDNSTLEANIKTLTIFRTPAEVLVAAYEGNLDEKIQFFFSALLPVDIPPSFKYVTEVFVLLS